MYYYERSLREQYCSNPADRFRPRRCIVCVERSWSRHLGIEQRTISYFIVVVVVMVNTSRLHWPVTAPCVVPVLVI